MYKYLIFLVLLATAACKTPKPATPAHSFTGHDSRVKRSEPISQPAYRRDHGLN